MVASGVSGTAYHHVVLMRAARVYHVAGHIGRWRCADIVDTSSWDISREALRPHEYARKGDVAIAISNSGMTEELIRSMQVASDAGATTICITGSVQSELARICDIALVATADERKYKPEPMSARIAQLSVIDVLSVAVAMTRQESLFQTLQKTRKAAQKDKQYNLDGGPL